MMKNRLEPVLDSKHMQAEIEKLRQENIAFQEEVDNLTIALLEAEAALVEEQMKAKKRQGTFKLIQLLSQKISGAKNIRDIYKITVQSLAEDIGFDRAIIFSKQNNVFQPVASWGYASENLTAHLGNPFVLDHLLENKGILVNGKTQKSYKQDYETDFQAKYFIAVPFSVHDEVNHILFVGNQTEDTLRRPVLTLSDMETLQILANQIAIAIRQVELYAETRASALQAQAQAQQLEEALQQLKQTQSQLIQTEKMSSLGQLVAGIAHEINNPVNFISGNIVHLRNYVRDLLSLLGLYQEYYPSPMPAIEEEAQKVELEFLREDLPKVLASMQMGTDRIRQIVLSLRNFSRTDEAQIKQVNIHQGIDNTLLILEHRIKQCGKSSGIEITKDYGNLPPVECYAGQLNQVFMNIISNAIDVLENHPAPRSIAIRTELKNEERTLKDENESLSSSPFPLHPCSVVVRIRDNGPGMTEAIRKRLFDPFFTTKPVGKGTGLGLSISHHVVVEKHGGAIACISEPDRGAEFCIEIPVRMLAPLKSSN